MSAAVTVTYGGDSPTAKVTAVHVKATDLPSNETQSSQNVTDGVLADPITYYLQGTDGTNVLQSQRFQVSTDPAGSPTNEFTWNGVIVPEAGDWTFSVRKDSDDTQVAAASPITFA